MTTMTPDNLAHFLRRFYNLYDGVFINVRCEWPAPMVTNVIVKVWLRDEFCPAGSVLQIQIDNVDEVVFREVNTSLQRMSHGLAVRWFGDQVWLAFQPYSTKIDNPDDFRKAYFYVVGNRCSWEVISDR